MEATSLMLGFLSTKSHYNAIAFKKVIKGDQSDLQKRGDQSDPRIGVCPLIENKGSYPGSRALILISATSSRTAGVVADPHKDNETEAFSVLLNCIMFHLGEAFTSSL